MLEAPPQRMQAAWAAPHAFSRDAASELRAACQHNQRNLPHTAQPTLRWCSSPEHFRRSSAADVTNSRFVIGRPLSPLPQRDESMLKVANQGSQLAAWWHCVACSIEPIALNLDLRLDMFGGQSRNRMSIASKRARVKNLVHQSIASTVSIKMPTFRQVRIRMTCMYACPSNQVQSLRKLRTAGS